jgi:hypothetical protein
MGDRDVILVPLYRCKQCKVRVFERDAHGHLERHGLTGINGNWREYFTKGRKDTPLKPGGHYKPLYQRSRQRKKT